MQLEQEALLLPLPGTDEWEAMAHWHLSFISYLSNKTVRTNQFMHKP